MNKVVIFVLGIFLGVIISVICKAFFEPLYTVFLETLVQESKSFKSEKDKAQFATDKMYKFKAYFELLNRWLELKNNGKDFIDFFKLYHIETIAIYGYGKLGKRTIEELKNYGYSIEYVVDRRKEIIEGFKAYNIDDALPKVDAIIVTAINEYGQIEQELKKKCDAKIVSLEDIIYYV